MFWRKRWVVKRKNSNTFAKKGSGWTSAMPLAQRFTDRTAASTVAAVLTFAGQGICIIKEV